MKKRIIFVLQMKEKDISKEARELVPNDRPSAPKYWRFDDLTEIHCELLRLEKEFLDSVEDYEGGKYTVKYRSAHIGSQMRMMADMSKRKYAIDGLPLGAWSVIEKLTGKFKLDNSMTMSEQWVSNVCHECEDVFDVKKKSQHSIYCDNKCKQSAAYKRKKANRKVDPIFRDVKTFKSYIKGIEELSTRYPQHTDTNTELALEILKKQLQNIEHEQF